ncbi:MAG: Fructose-1,6-bisphosphatase, Mycobacterial type SUP1; Sugar phosphatase SUP1, partial [uncultured Friedmanniella sp.]
DRALRRPPRRDRVERERPAHLGDRSAAHRARRGAGPAADRAPRSRELPAGAQQPPPSGPGHRRAGRVHGRPRAAARRGPGRVGLRRLRGPDQPGDPRGGAGLDDLEPPDAGRGDGRPARRAAGPGGPQGARVGRRTGHLLRPRAQPAGPGHALAGLRARPRRALPARHQHRVRAGRGEGPAGARALERPAL